MAEEYRKKIAAAGMPEKVQQQAERELSRFERMGDSNAESSMIRTYLDWLLAGCRSSAHTARRENQGGAARADDVVASHPGATL